MMSDFTSIGCIRPRLFQRGCLSQPLGGICILKRCEGSTRSLRFLIFTSSFSSGTFSIGPRKDLPTQPLPPRAHGPGRHADAAPPHHRHHQVGGNEEARLSRQPRRIAALSHLRGFASRPIGRCHHADRVVSGAKPSRWPTVSNLFLCSSVIFRHLAQIRNSFIPHRSRWSCSINLSS